MKPFSFLQILPGSACDRITYSKMRNISVCMILNGGPFSMRSFIFIYLFIYLFIYFMKWHYLNGLCLVIYHSVRCSLKRHIFNDCPIRESIKQQNGSSSSISYRSLSIRYQSQRNLPRKNCWRRLFLNHI